MEKLCELSEIKDGVIYLPTAFLYKRTMKDNLNSCDIWTRFLAIDNYYGKNNDGFDIYNEIQHYRVNQIREIPREQYDNEETFRKLIASFEKHGFLKEHPLDLNKDFMVVDGAHRLALSLYNKIELVPVRFQEKYYNFDFDYSIKWLRENGFSKYEERLMREYYRIEEMIKSKEN